MGISGLLPLLKSISVNTHVKNYAQQTLGVDAYVWLHRGAISCAWDLALDRPTKKYVDYAMHRVRMLIHHGVTPYIVFDGDYLPSKARTESERETRRSVNTKLGKECLSRGDSKSAQEYFQKAIDVTPDMAYRFIKALQNENIKYVVAPYEADAQLAYLEREGLIDGIITEDSDLLVFGCQKVLYKMNEFGECTEISRARFRDNTGLKLAGWTDDMFRYMAILSGCDYLAGVPGMGLKKAHQLVRKYKTIDHIFRGLKLEFGLKVPADYEENFRRADLTFLHQMVFCPTKQSVVMSREASTVLDSETVRLIGIAQPEDIARAIASGQLDPITKEEIVLNDLGAGTSLGRRPPLRYSATAPVGNMLLDSFLSPKTDRPSEVQETNSGVKALATLDPNQVTPRNASSEVSSKRTGFNEIMSEQATKKLKLFDSSDSPPNRLPGRLSMSANSIQHNKENLINPFFASRSRVDSPRKVSREELDLEAAIKASMLEEEKRKTFEGFQNPVGFEVEDVLDSSKYFRDPTDAAPRATRAEESTQHNSVVQLATPPNSQDLSVLATSWAAKFSLRTTASSSPTPTASRSRPTSSLSRMGGRVLSRQSSLPNFLHSSTALKQEQKRNLSGTSASQPTKPTGE